MLTKLKTYVKIACLCLVMGLSGCSYLINLYNHDTHDTLTKKGTCPFWKTPLGCPANAYKGVALKRRQILSEFHDIQIAANGKFTIVQGKGEYRIEALGRNAMLSHMYAYVDNQILHINVQAGYQDDALSPIITIHAPSLHNINLFGNGELALPALHDHDVTIEVGGISKVRVAGQVNHLHVTLAGDVSMDARDLLITDTLTSLVTGTSLLKYAHDPKMVSNYTRGRGLVLRTQGLRYAQLCPHDCFATSHEDFQISYSLVGLLG